VTWCVIGIGERRVNTGFRWGCLRERSHFEDLDLDGQIILKLIFKKWDGSTDWINLAHDRKK
jgi:hypothetical protein